MVRVSPRQLMSGHSEWLNPNWQSTEGSWTSWEEPLIGTKGRRTRSWQPDLTQLPSRYQWTKRCWQDCQRRTTQSYQIAWSIRKQRSSNGEARSSTIVFSETDLLPIIRLPKKKEKSKCLRSLRCTKSTQPSQSAYRSLRCTKST